MLPQRLRTRSHVKLHAIYFWRNARSAAQRRALESDGSIEIAEIGGCATLPEIQRYTEDAHRCVLAQRVRDREGK